MLSEGHPLRNQAIACAAARARCKAAEVLHGRGSELHVLALEEWDDEWQALMRPVYVVDQAVNNEEV